MPRNGTGGYSLPPGINPVVSGTLIASVWANTTLADIALALTNSVSKDGQTAMTGNLNMGTNRVINVGDAVADTDAVNVRYLDSKGLDRVGVSGWARPESGTYPPLTLTGDYTINVPAGNGYIINPELGTTQVIWDAEAVVLTNVLTEWATTIAIDASGNVVQLIGNVDEAWARSYIILAVAVHPLGVVTSILNAPNILGNVAYGMYDLAMIDRNRNMEGGQISGNVDDDLSFDMAARRVFYYGGTPNVPDAVNFVDHDAIEGVRFFPITGNSTAAASTFDVPVTMYDPLGAGTPVAIPGDSNASTVFRLYEMAGTCFLLYGQHVYNTLEAAVLAIGSEELVMPEKLSNATLVGVIVAKKSTTDLKDPDDVQLVSNPGSGGGGTSVNVDGYVWRTVEVFTDTIIDRSFRNTLIYSKQATAIQITIRENTGSETLDWRLDDGPFMILQAAGGKVTLVIEGGDTLKVPSGFTAETRTNGSIISGSCYDLANGAWAVSGDMLQSVADPNKMFFQIDDRVVPVISTNIAAGTLRNIFVAPFDIQLETIANGGLFATLATAQAAGALVTVDVNVNGVSILSTKLTFNNTEKTTRTAAAPAVYEAAFTSANRIITAGSEISYDVDSIGTALAKGISLYGNFVRAS